MPACVIRKATSMYGTWPKAVPNGYDGLDPSHPWNICIRNFGDETSKYTTWDGTHPGTCKRYSLSQVTLDPTHVV
jgi:hypothetical protein